MTGQILNITAGSFKVEVIINGRPVTALVDTGASVSCVTLSLVHHRFLTSTPFTLTATNGVPLDVRGTVPLQFSLDKRAFNFNFAIKNLSHPLILGLDFLTIHRATLDCAEKKIFMKPEINNLTTNNSLSSQGRALYTGRELVKCSRSSRTWSNLRLGGPKSLQWNFR